MTVLTNASVPVDPASQMSPTNPAAGQSVDIWVRVGYSLQINTCYIYYTTDGSNPEGAFGVGKGTTQVVQAQWVNYDNAQGNIDWWKGTIPGQANGAQVRYKVALFSGGSTVLRRGHHELASSTDFLRRTFQFQALWPDAGGHHEFQPATAVVWLHNDLNPANTTVGLQSGFHIVRARTFLPVSNYYTNQSVLTTSTHKLRLCQSSAGVQYLRANFLL